MLIEKFPDGIVICGDASSQEVIDTIKRELGPAFVAALVIADPPYGDIVKKEWDKRWRGKPKELTAWMVKWTNLWRQFLIKNGTFFVWGGIGKVEFRPFFRYIIEVEKKKEFELANLITWSKKRAYGVQNNYLFTREEAAFFINGDAVHPAIFNIPYLEKLRGYKGYNKKYPAKDDRLRRTNVWMDITEIFKGKIHVNQKADKLYEVIIETHTNLGDWVIDPFAGSGTTAKLARKLGRKFVLVEYEKEDFDKIVSYLK